MTTLHDDEIDKLIRSATAGSQAEREDAGGILRGWAIEVLAGQLVVSDAGRERLLECTQQLRTEG